MRKGLAAAAACVVLAASAISPAASAAGRHNNGDREQFMQNYCGSHNDSDCRDWSQHRDRWDDAHYHSWYERHHHDHGFDPGAAALFGFAAGAAAGMITGTVNGAVNGGHVAACEERYRSYDPDTDTFVGRDGYRHECRL